MEKKSNKPIIFFLFFLSIFALSSCKLKAEQKSLTSHFEMIDILISDNDFSAAVKELKKTEKQAFDSWSYIGIYKRYAQIGETEKAEKIIKKALKKNSHNEELLAIYSNCLLRKDELDEAKKIAFDLRGTKYGSLYSEAVLKLAKKENLEKNDPDYFKNPDYFDVYLDAYKGSLNPLWIRNCAIFNLKEGLFENAASLLPISYADADDAYFWALVLFDSGKYYEAIDALESSRSFLRDYPDTNYRNNYKVTEIQQVALESDAYLTVAKMDEAEKLRQDVIQKLEQTENLSQIDDELLSKIVVNSSIYAQNTGNDNECADLLFYAVNRWPDNVSALILYSNFAYISNLEAEEDFEVQSLREKGISSLTMEKYDNRRKIPLSDAIYRLEQALERTKNPYLSIAKLDLKYKMDNSWTVKTKTADLWMELENNYSEQENYQGLLVEYVISYFLKTKQYDSAKTLFVKYIKSAYGIIEDQDFWVNIEKNLSKMDLKMAEFAALFATYEDLYDESLRIFEYCVYESGGLLFEGIISPKVSIYSCMNLADLYFSSGKKEKAIDLYGKAAGRETNSYVRSEIFYRVANIYVAQNDIKNALRSVDYALLLYPNNARAALLKEKLK